MSGSALFSREWPLCCLDIDGTVAPWGDNPWPLRPAADRATQTNAAAALPVAPGGGDLRVYAGAGCSGSHTVINSENAEERCLNCWDSCGKHFVAPARDPAHNDQGTLVRSVRVTGRVRATAYQTNCFGTWEYPEEALVDSQLRTLDASAGCVDLPITHLQWEVAQPAVADAARAGDAGIATLYAGSGCTGSSAVFSSDYEERRCSACYDGCGKVFEDGTDVHNAAGGHVKSLRVPRRFILTAFDDACHGSFKYERKDFGAARNYSGSSGCVDLQGALPIHFVLSAA